jgi:3-oxoacyl-[acyl-carrier-protein] synthase-1
MAVDLAITGLGMISPVGADAVQTFTSVRAAIRRIEEHPEIYCCLPEDPRLDRGSPLVASAVYHLDTTPRRENRPIEWLGFLAGRAFADLERNAKLSGEDSGRLGVFLALPARPGLGPEVCGEVAYHFYNHARRDPVAEFHLAFGGHATALGLAEQAAIMLRDRRIEMAAVGGVDSYLFREWLEPLDREWRILSDRNSDGFQPGEAAAFFLLERSSDARRRGARAAARVGLLASSKVAEGGQPNTGIALAALLGQMIPPGDAPLFVCDLNGDSARTREWAYALARMGKRLDGGYALETPAQVLGDVGAASGAALVVLAAQYLSTRHADRKRAVIWSASEDGQRRSLLVTRSESPDCEGRPMTQRSFSECQS